LENSLDKFRKGCLCIAGKSNETGVEKPLTEYVEKTEKGLKPK